MWLILGITGITGGGKTTLSTALYDYFTKLSSKSEFSNRRINSVNILHQDKYFYHRDSPKHIRIEEINFINREVMSAMDMDSMWQDIQVILNGSDVSTADDAIDILIIEGFLIFKYRPIYELCDMRFFFELPSDVCWERRLKRTFKHVNPRPEYYFDHFIWPTYQNYLNEIKSQSSDIIYLNGVDDPSVTFNRVLELITAKVNNFIER